MCSLSCKRPVVCQSYFTGLSCCNPESETPRCNVLKSADKQYGKITLCCGMQQRYASTMWEWRSLLTIRYTSKRNRNDLVLLNSCATVKFLCCSQYTIVDDRPKHTKSHLQTMPYELVQAAALKLLKLAL